MLALLAAWTATVEAQTATLEAPAEATIGSGVEVAWTGPGEDYDPIVLVPAGAPDDARSLASVAILNGKNPLTLVMPDQPGSYELRYLSSKQVMARRPIRVVDVPTSIAAPASAPVGSRLEVTFEGPGNAYDTIGLYEKGAADDAKQVAGAAILRPGQTIIVNLPDDAGDYELRYKTSKTKRTLATRPITVEAVPTSLTAPAAGDIGATIEIGWEGPGNDYDQIVLVPAGAADDARPVASAAILNGKNPLAMRLPEQAGGYELQYRTTRSKRVLARRPIRVGAVAASLDAPASVTAATLVEVVWQGPGNDYDQVAVFAPGAADDAEAVVTAAILNDRNPVSLRMPEAEGSYELRYRTTQSKQVLARRPIRVEPAGRLAVVRERQGETVASQGEGAVELILDASGSMLKRENGIRRIEIARTVLGELVREHLGDDRDFALRVFGHKEADSCRTDLEIPLGPLDREGAAARIASVDAMNLAKTPIADSLAKVPTDLAGARGPKTIILITDGEETCDGDPAAVIQNLRARGLDIQVSIVGFAIDDEALQQSFETWAELGGGSYFDARSADELRASLRTVISGPYRVLDSAGEMVGEGIIGGAPIVLPAGTYRVETVSRTPMVIDDVEVAPRELTEVAF